MLQPRVVFSPIDFSDPARDAADTAADLASRYGAALVLLHVVPALPKLPAGVSVFVSVFKEGEYERRLHEDAVRRIAEVADKYAQTGISVRSEVGVANDVGMEIVRIAERNKADLIVIATHGLTGWNKIVFGSVAEKVVRLAESPVLLLKAPPTNKR
jgi:nucleotide-binding universal stress UspA family protein